MQGSSSATATSEKGRDGGGEGVRGQWWGRGARVVGVAGESATK